MESQPLLKLRISLTRCLLKICLYCTIIWLSILKSRNNLNLKSQHLLNQPLILWKRSHNPHHPAALPTNSFNSTSIPTNSPSSLSPNLFFKVVTFPDESTNLKETSKHFTYLHNLTHFESDLEAYLTNPTFDLETQSFGIAIFGDDPSKAYLPLSILPSIPKDINQLVSSSPSPHPSSSTISLIIPPSPPKSLNLQGLATILAHHGLYIIVVPSLPPPKTKKMISTASKHAKLQRELQNIKCLTHYDKSTTLAILEGEDGDQ